MTVNQAISSKILAQGLRIIIYRKPEGLMRRIIKEGNSQDGVRLRADMGGLQRARVGYQGGKGVGQQVCHPV